MRNISTFKIVSMQPTRNMSVDAHEILFGYKHNLVNWKNCHHLNLFTFKNYTIILFFGY